MIGVYTFGVIRVWVVGVFPRRGWDSIKGGSCVFVFVMGLYCVNDGLGVGCYFIGCSVADDGRLGWSLARGWRLAAVFRLSWYRFGLFLYRASSFFRIVSMSLWFALLMMETIAL